MSDLHLYPDRRTVTKMYPVCLFYPTLAIFVPIVNKGSISWPQEGLLCYVTLAHKWEVSVQSLWSAWVDVSVHWLMQFSIKRYGNLTIMNCTRIFNCQYFPQDKPNKALGAILHCYVTNSFCCKGIFRKCTPGSQMNSSPKPYLSQHKQTIGT